MFRFLFSTKIRCYIILCLLFILLILISGINYSNSVFEDISNSVFRLHVIANSDSEEDQNLKLKVRDAVLEYMNTLVTNDMTKNDIISLAKDHINDFNLIASNIIKEEGYSYNVEIEIDNSFFPTKSYGNITFPSGYYDCMKIKIGKAEGHNWWCVMFPPLCFIDINSAIVDSSSNDILKSNLSDEEYSLISDNSTDIKIKFKFIELFNSSINSLVTAKH